MRRANIKPYLTPKVDYILKLSNYYVTTQITHVFRTKVQMFTPFLEIDSKFGTRVLWSPTQPLTNVLFCFFVGNFGSLNIRKTNKKVSGEKHTHSSTAGLKFIGHGCHILGNISRKRREHWMLNKFGAICLNQPVGVINVEAHDAHCRVASTIIIQLNDSY